MAAEYIWNYHFYQDGSIEIEVRLTGILQVYTAKDGEPNPYGTTVAPNVNAHYHQHIFSFRIDPMIDGLNNTVVESDMIPLDFPTGSPENFAGNGFQVRDTILTEETARQYDISKDRRWKIINQSRNHYSSGKPVGYSVGFKGGITPLLGQLDGWTSQRAGFVTAPLWVIKEVEDKHIGPRMWPSGKYVPQTRSAPEDSISKWADGKKNVVDDDIVLFVTVGTTHIPRPEDWPV